MATGKEILTKLVILWCFLSVITSGQIKDSPPEVEFPLSQDQVIVKTHQREHFMIKCTANGDPVPTYRWKKDDHLLTDDDEFTKTLKNGTLYFKRFSDKDNGLYQCFATNKHGTSLSVKVPLVNEKPATSNTHREARQSDVKVNEGEPLGLDCANAPGIVPAPKKRWYLRIGTSEVKLNERIGTDSMGTLRFAYVEASDAQTYTCGLVPILLSPYGEIILDSPTRLQVMHRSAGTSPPKLEFRSGDTKAIVGQNVSLECFFSGRPLANITWKNNKKTVIEPSGDSQFRLEDFNRRLIILKVDKSLEGKFSCTGDNGFGQASASIFVKVTSPPTKDPEHGLTSVVKPDRHNVVLQCKAKSAFGETLNVPVWYRNGHSLNKDNLPDPKRYSFKENYTELHIESPNKINDTASFQCNVSNSERYVFYDGYLKVIESIKVTKQPDTFLTVSGDKIDISVIAEGDSCCNIAKDWYLNGVLLSKERLNSPPFVFDEKNDVSWFDPSLVSNETLVSSVGDFVCHISNGWDFQEVRFSISMNAVPSVQELITATAGGMEFWWVALVCGVLFVVIAGVTIFIFIKMNYPRKTYQLEKNEIKHRLNPKQELLDHSFQEL